MKGIPTPNFILQKESNSENEWDLIEAESIIRSNWKKFKILPQRGDYIADDGGYIFRVIGFQWSHGYVTIWINTKLK